MNKFTEYNGTPVKFIESSTVKEGVVCDAYEFVDDHTKDLGIIYVAKGYKTPLQEIVGGEKTLEIFREGRGILIVTDHNGNQHRYHFPSEQTQVEVQVGEQMQWEALEDLIFAEICYPPYKEGRFRELSE